MKHKAWDSLGLKFWKLGRKSAKPSIETLRWYTKGILPGDHCLVIGGTSISIIREAEKKVGNVVVADFSEVICRELKQYVSNNVTVINSDILQAQADWNNRFHFVFADTLINRFDWEEAKQFSKEIFRILRPGGQIRTTVKIGLYPMDKKLIEIAGEEAKTFWDEKSQTIVFSKAEKWLERGLVAHGSISKKDLLVWYTNRGREKRYSLDDLKILFDHTGWINFHTEKDYLSKDRVRLVVTKQG